MVPPFFLGGPVWGNYYFNRKSFLYSVKTKLCRPLLQQGGNRGAHGNAEALAQFLHSVHVFGLDGLKTVF